MIQFDLRAVGDAEPERNEDILKFFLHDRQRMHAALRNIRRGLRDVDAFQLQTRGLFRGAQRGKAAFQRRFDAAAHVVDLLAEGRAFLFGQRAHAAHHRRQFAFFPEDADADLFDRGRIPARFERFERLALNALQLVVVHSSCSFFNVVSRV